MAGGQKAHAVREILSLGEGFYDSVEPAKFPIHKIRYQNFEIEEKLGFSFTESEWVDYFGKFHSFPGSLEKPLALRYHGHQFQHYNPQLGDGRGFLYAQLKYAQHLYDFGTKGSGQTPYSRRGDGRLTLKGAVREALATEYLEKQGVNTSKTFCIIETGENLERNDEPSPTRSAVLTRLSHGHIRIGSFQRLAYMQDKEALELLLDYCCKNFYPEIKEEGNQKILRFLQMVTSACAKTCAEWMMAGFVHGVLNTDNINITGESFDYGPYRFLPKYDPHFVAAYFDHEALYAYGRQPDIIYWNLQQLALCFSLFFESREPLVKALQIYPQVFSQNLMRLFLKRLNLQTKNQVENNKLFSFVFDFMEDSGVPFEDFFFDWYGGVERGQKSMMGKRKDFYKGDKFNSFYNQIKVFDRASEAFQEKEYYQKENPESLLIDEIESIWSAIDKKDDWSLFYEKLNKIRNSHF